jgi:hypothetical protein
MCCAAQEKRELRPRLSRALRRAAQAKCELRPSQASRKKSATCVCDCDRAKLLAALRKKSAYCDCGQGAAPGGHPAPGGRDLRGVALLVQPPVPAGAAARLTRPRPGRPPRRQVGAWGKCGDGGGTLPSAFHEEKARAPAYTASPKHPSLACLVSPCMWL